MPFVTHFIHCFESVRGKTVTLASRGQSCGGRALDTPETWASVPWSAGRFLASTRSHGGKNKHSINSQSEPRASRSAWERFHQPWMGQRPGPTRMIRPHPQAVWPELSQSCSLPIPEFPRGSHLLHKDVWGNPSPPHGSLNIPRTRAAPGT